LKKGWEIRERRKRVEGWKRKWEGEKTTEVTRIRVERYLQAWNKQTADVRGNQEMAGGGVRRLAETVNANCSGHRIVVTSKGKVSVDPRAPQGIKNGNNRKGTPIRSEIKLDETRAAI